MSCRPCDFEVHEIAENLEEAGECDQTIPEFVEVQTPKEEPPKPIAGMLTEKSETGSSGSKSELCGVYRIHENADCGLRPKG